MNAATVREVVSSTEHNGITVSTVRIDGQYETMAFDSNDELAQKRTWSRDEASANHASMCQRFHAVTFSNATLYLRGDLSIQKIECKSISIHVRPHAQYAKAVVVRYVPKGCRSPRGTVLSYQPWGYVVEGFGHVDPASMFTAPIDSAPGVQVSRSRYSSCDPRTAADFEAKLGDTKVAVDFSKLVK